VTIDTDTVRGASVDLDEDELDTDATETGESEPESAESEPDNAATAPARRSMLRSILGRWRVIVAAVAVTASVAVAGFLYLTQYRMDLATDDAATTGAVQAATDGTVAVLTYKPETIDADLAAAQSHLTGEFLTYYTEFSEEILKPAAKDRAVTTEAAVVGAADTEIGPGSATVLVFVNQSTVSRDRPEAAQSASSVLVSLNKVDGRWLISAFEPV
jgi:Mce-associated membrane protein